ncbi:MAG: hypothetical protein EZS28_047936, partial [Streblomastix strix]
SEVIKAQIFKGDKLVRGQTEEQVTSRVPSDVQVTVSLIKPKSIEILKIMLKTVNRTKVKPLSVASTIKSKNGIKKIYFDVRQEQFCESSNEGRSFIEKWLDQVFEEAKQINDDNIYDDPDIPYDIPVPVLGYNSAHFDMIFVLPYLTNSNWRITSYLGDFSHIKRITVKHKISGVSIQFLDAILFITKESLKQFAIDFGDGGKDGNKGVFPYDAINSENYKETVRTLITVGITYNITMNWIQLS